MNSACPKRTFIKPLQKRLLRPPPRLQQNPHNMLLQLPAIHRLLVLLASLQNEDVDGAGVSDVAGFFEAFADGVPHEGGGDVECVEGDDFWGLLGGWVSMVAQKLLWGDDDGRHGTTRGRAGVHVCGRSRGWSRSESQSLDGPVSSPLLE